MFNYLRSGASVVSVPESVGWLRDVRPALDEENDETDDGALLARAAVVNRWISASGNSWRSFLARGNSCWKAELWWCPALLCDWPPAPPAFAAVVLVPSSDESPPAWASFRWMKRTAGDFSPWRDKVASSPPPRSPPMDVEPLEEDAEELLFWLLSLLLLLLTAPRHNLPPLRMPVRGGSGKGTTKSAASLPSLAASCCSCSCRFASIFGDSSAVWASTQPLSNASASSAIASSSS